MMRRNKRLSSWSAGIVLPLLLLGAGGGEPAKEQDDGMDMYFRDSALEALAKQDLAAYRETDAGESKKFDRSFPDAPPQIPHTVEDMLPITMRENECLECHAPENAIEKEDIPLPKTHFKHPQMAKGKKGDPMVWVVKSYEEKKEMVGSRYNCTMCHTPQAENARTLPNSFQKIGGKPTQ
jgi:cytochrome c-type protein NapB